MRKVFFDKEHHRYFDDLGRDYLSVTTLINGKEKFDRVAVATKVIQNPRSKYYRCTLDEVLAQWEGSAKLGTKIHEEVESFINTKQISMDSPYKPFLEKFAKLKFRGSLLSEQIVFDEDYLIAGTIDLLEDWDNCYWIYDLKTCVSDNHGQLGDSRLYKYSLQLEIYRRLAEKCLNKQSRAVGIIWFKDANNNPKKHILNIIPISDVNQEVSKLLKTRKMEIKKK